MALLSEIATTDVNTASMRDPRIQFLPENAFGTGLADGISYPLISSGLPLVGEAGSGSSRQTLTCRIPTLMTLVPIHAISWTLETHLLLACNLAEPFFEIDHKKIKPSLILPSEQSHRESAEKATDRTPKLLCSLRVVSGVSSGASSAKEKILILGCTPFCSI